MPFPSGSIPHGFPVCLPLNIVLHAVLIKQQELFRRIFRNHFSISHYWAALELYRHLCPNAINRDSNIFHEIHAMKIDIANASRVTNIWFVFLMSGGLPNRHP